MDGRNIHTIGVWILKTSLTIGAIIASILGNEEAASTLIFGFVMSFAFLSTEEE